MKVVGKDSKGQEQRQEREAVIAERGRRAEIDLVELERLCMLHCTDTELADWFGVTTRTIERRRTEPEFAAAMRRGKSKGKISLRRAQMRLVEQGNAVMSIFLGKQWLGQVDQVSHDINVVQIAVLPQGSSFQQLESEDVLDIEATR